MQSKFPLEMLRPLLKNNPCFWANDQDFLCHSLVLSFEVHIFFFGLIPDWEKAKSYIFRYNKLKNIRFYIFIFCFYMLFERLMVVLNVLKEKRPSVSLVIQYFSVCFFCCKFPSTHTFFLILQIHKRGISYFCPQLWFNKTVTWCPITFCCLYDNYLFIEL